MPSKEAPSSGFATKSSAPSSRALKTSARRDCEETTTTGVGRRAMSRRRNVNPSIRGICEVEEDEVRLEPQHLPERLLAVARRPHDDDPGAALEDAPDRAPARLGVVDEEHAGGPRPVARRVPSRKRLSRRAARRLAVHEVGAEVDDLEVGGEVDERLGVAEEEPAAVAQLPWKVRSTCFRAATSK